MIKENRFCVYLHRRSDNDKVVYVGQGTLPRVTNRNGRNKKWCEIYETSGIYAQIIKENLTKEEALVLEKDLMDVYPDLVNAKYHSSRTRNLEFDLFNKWFEVCTESPSGLIWKCDNKGRSTGFRKKGEMAGNIRETGYCKRKYWVGSLNNMNFKVHRVVYLLSKGCLDLDKVIDHVDRNPLNNNIENLREVTRSENSSNQSINSKNVTGFQGVRYREIDGIGYYIGIWHKGGRQHSKSFSLNKYGKEEAFRLALYHRNLNHIGIDNE